MSLQTFESKTGKLLEKIYTDLSLNVTRIYNRPLAHMAVDLAFHSVLFFKFRGIALSRGWLDIILIGDTRTGKTEICKNLIKHYKVGELITGENISKPGLVGGINTVNKRWLIKWGKLPLNDRRLVVMDEASGLTELLISELSGIRSSGIAEIIKIRTEKTFARTRLIWLSNPQTRRGINSYSFAVQSIQDLVKRPEDIARFDYSTVLKTDDVPIEVINARELPKAEHIYTSDVCSRVVLWAWSRRAEHIKFTKEAEERVLDVATLLGKKYSPDIPLVEPNEIKIKVARISVALAARLFSTPDGINLVVTPEHVSTVYDFLEDIYRELSYDTFSLTRKYALPEEKKDELRKLLVLRGNEFISGISELNVINDHDVADLTSDDIIGARSIISLLVRRGCFKRYKSGYIKTPMFIEMLRDVQKDLKPVGEIKND